MSNWTEERVALLTKLWNEGQSGGQISKRLGITRNAVIGKVTRLGLPQRAQPSRPVRRPPTRLAHPKPRRLRDDEAGGGEHRNDQLDREILALIEEGCELPDIIAAYPERGALQVQKLARELQRA